MKKTREKIRKKLNKLNEIINVLEKHDWVWRWSGNWPLLDAVIQRDHNFVRELKGITGGTTLERNLDFYKGSILTTYHSRQEYERIHRVIRVRFEKNPSSLLTSFKDFETRTEEDLKVLENIAAQTKKTQLSEKKFANLFQSSRKPWAHNAAMDLYCLYAEEAVLPILKTYLGHRLAELNRKNELVPYLTKLTTPLKPTQFLFERKSFFKILNTLKSSRIPKKYFSAKKQLKEFIEKNPKQKQALTKHLQIYDWLPVLVNNPPMSFDGLCEELRNYLLRDEKDYRVEQKSIQGLLSGHIFREVENIITELKPNKKTSLLIKGLQEMAYVRTQTGVVISRSAYLMIPFYKEVARRLGTTYPDLKLLLPGDIVRLLREGKSATNLIKKHRRSTVYINDKEKRHVFTGKDAKKIKEWLAAQLQQKEASAEEIKGTSANPGIKQGYVKVAMSSAEIDKVKEGDILVAPATSVDFVPAMRKAAAIITETGGITSHAAIVSRELGVPCVVGAKQVTKVLKDGDLVEVDAERGIVKIIKRKE